MKITCLCITASFAIALMMGCNDRSPAATPSGLKRPPALKALHPESTVAGSKFNVQPNGESALAIDCEGATPNAVIIFGKERLNTAFGSEKLITAVVPAQLVSQPGTISVHVENEAGQSNILMFTVR